MPICHFCQVSIKDYEKVCKQCLFQHGSPVEDGGTSVIINGEEIVYYETFHRNHKTPKNFKLDRCLKCQKKCGKPLCDKCKEENTTHSILNGAPHSLTVIENTFSETFDCEINCENFN